MSTAGDSLYLGAELRWSGCSTTPFLRKWQTSRPAQPCSISTLAARAPDNKTRLAFGIAPVDLSEKEGVARAKELQDDLGAMTNKHLTSLAMTIAIVGICYVRPEARTSIWITSLKNIYYYCPALCRNYIKASSCRA